MQAISYLPVLLRYDDDEEAAPTPASLKCFAAFPKIRSLSIHMDSDYVMSPWILQLDAALEGFLLSLAPLP